MGYADERVVQVIMKKEMMTEDLLKEWDYELNKGVDPKSLARSSKYNAYWRCPKCKGVWQSKVKNRTNGSGCPYCTGRKVLRGFNDFETLYPHLAKQWKSSEHGKNPWEVTKGSHENVLWECEKGHRWEAKVKDRVAGNDCPFCSGRFAITGQNDIQTLQPELMKEWNWKKNKDVDPSKITEKSNKKYWWICKKCGYEWQASPAHRIGNDRERGRGCPCCNHKAVVPGKNDAATYNNSVLDEWDSALNGGKQLSEFLPGSNKRGIWTCRKYGLTWEAQIKSRVMDGKGCPFCSGKRPVQNVTDLQTVRPDIAYEWHPTKNGSLTPNQFTQYAHKRVWWLCRECGHEWPSTIANRAIGKGCPCCASNRPE